MIWGNPWALAGLAAVAVPILVHLLARQASTAVPFPTLRFFQARPLVNLRRRRLADLLLLTVRVAIVGLAALALAQPFVTQRTPARVNRLVIVDATASVAIEEARQAARAYGDGADAFLVVERKDLRQALRETAAWAAARSGASSIAIVSDFQRGVIDRDALDALPPGVGLRLHRVARREPGAPGVAGIEGMSMDDARTTAIWGPDSGSPAGITIEGAGNTMAAAIAAAARATAEGTRGRLRPAMFVLPDSPRRTALLESSSPGTEPWLFELFAAIGAGKAETVRVEGGRAVVFLNTNEPAAVADAVREAMPALADGVPLPELEPSAISDEQLKTLERDPAPAGPVEAPASWAGRWLWLATLLLLAVESVMRRTRRTGDAEVLADAA